ncbi:hypothetical protein BJX70DRAFT_325295 [Aspergillus crustosus]
MNKACTCKSTRRDRHPDEWNHLESAQFPANSLAGGAGSVASFLNWPAWGRYLGIMNSRMTRASKKVRLKRRVFPPKDSSQRRSYSWNSKFTICLIFTRLSTIPRPTDYPPQLPHYLTLVSFISSFSLSLFSFSIVYPALPHLCALSLCTVYTVLANIILLPSRSSSDCRSIYTLPGCSGSCLPVFTIPQSFCDPSDIQPLNNRQSSPVNTLKYSFKLPLERPT